jgi:hypothetical protein
MLKRLPLLALGCLAMTAHGQSTSPEVIASSGDHFDNGTNSISYTIGEPVILTVSSTNNTLTQGFHQTSLLIDAVAEGPEYSGISVYPNPTNNQITISAEQLGLYDDAHLFDASGRLVWTQNESAPALQSSVDMTSMASGLYFLRLSKSDQSSLEFKILKQ